MIPVFSIVILWTNLPLDLKFPLNQGQVPLAALFQITSTSQPSIPSIF